MSHIGSNDPCPCGSGSKFKICCLPKVQTISVRDVFIPYLKLPFSISLAVTLTPLQSDDPEFLSLFSIGDTYDEEEYIWKSGALGSNLIMRFGFCNRELRPIIQIRTTRGVFELVGKDVVKPGYTAFDINFNNAKNQIELYANGKALETGPLEGQLDFNKHQNVVYVLSPGFVIWCCKVQRYLLTGDQIDKLEVTIPDDFSSWKEHKLAYDKITHLVEDHDTAYVYISKPTAHLLNPRLRTVYSVLSADGKIANDFRDDSEASSAASYTILSLTGELTSIINSDKTTENDLLRFFKARPAAAFLIEPELVRQFREDEIQHYGRIDFLFALTDKSLRVVEIESHNAKIFLKSPEFSSDMNHAIHQVKTWIRGAAKNPDHFKVRLNDTETRAFFGLVIIGRSNQFDSHLKQETWNARNVSTI